MNVFTLYNPATAGLLRLWALSWQRQGWKTRLLSARDLKKAGSLKRAIPKGQLFVLPTAINFGFPPRKNKKIRIAKFPAKGWERAPVVQFTREFEVLNCGRHF